MVMAALTGTLLATMLLIPGLCMVIGGLKYRDQRFNLKSASVSSALLFVSIAGAYTPSLFQKMHGSSHMECTNCSDVFGQVNCTVCYWENQKMAVLENDPVYHNRTRPLVWTCCALLPFAYLAGLIYTLRTHAHIYDEKHSGLHERDEDEDGEGGHGGGGHDTGHGPIWSRCPSAASCFCSLFRIHTGWLVWLCRLILGVDSGTEAYVIRPP